jgi:two-component system response regulator HydG
MADARVLVVDDVVDMANTVARELEREGFEVTVADAGAAAIDLVGREPFEVVVTDLRMREHDGLDVLAAVKRADPESAVIIMTAFGAIDSAVEAIRRGAFHYVTKPFELDALVQLVKRAARERALARENDRLRRALREHVQQRTLLGRTPVMARLDALIDRVAEASSPVLITGETGTGKELVAQQIHERGPRRDKPFVAVNCAALPEQLLESELFGHARGAFTGASQNRRGLFVQAHEGTLLLDEIGDLPLALQGKLLRALQSGEVRAVGSETARTVDVRCLAATHKNLAEAVAQGTFREDLFFRLDVLRVDVPPLRERSDDLPLLIERFLRRSRERFPRSTLTGLSPEALAFLRSYSWPGNVRELENLVERLAVTTTSALAEEGEVRTTIGQGREIDPLAALLRKPMTLAELETRYIAAVLGLVGGSKPKAAELLGIDLSTLYRREKSGG